MIDYKLLFARMEDKGLTDLSFAEMNKKQMKSLVETILSCMATECCYKYICEQVPSYMAKCTGDDKCKRLVYFAQNKIPKREQA